MANSSVLADLQSAIYSELSGDTGTGSITDLVGTDGNGDTKVYDRPPEEVGYPYIRIGDDTERAWGNADSVGSETTVTLHVFSGSAGTIEAKNILSRCRELLDRNHSLSISNHTTVAVQHDFSRTLTIERQSETVVHGIQRYEVTTDNA